MVRKLGKKNMILFVLFSFLTLLIILLFSYAVYKTFSYDKNIYDINSGSFMYDEDNNYVLLEENAKIQQRWNKKYYLSLDSSKTATNLGNDVVVYNEKDYNLQLFGELFLIKSNGEVVSYENKTEVSRNNSSTLYKLEDRKYLIVGQRIYTESKEIDTKNYLIVEIDKSGNALLLNNELNIKTLSTLVLQTDGFSFDIANEKMIVGKNEIDLKKINGSTNQYVEPTDEDSDNKDKDAAEGNSSNNNFNNNNNNNNLNSTVTNNFGGGATGSISNNIIKDNSSESKIYKYLNLTSVVSYASYIDVSYSISDPKGEYVSVYLLVQGGDQSDGTQFEQRITLNKELTKYRIRDLKANTKYKISLCYSYLDSSGSLIEEIHNVVNAKTLSNKSKITVTRVTSSRVYFNVMYDSSYAYDSADVVLYSNDGVTLVGSSAVDTAKALSENGFSSYIDTGASLTGTVELRLENCKYNGVVNPNCNISVRFRR